MHFVPENLARSSYRGYVCLDGDEFAVRVSNVMHDTRTDRLVLEYAQLDVDCALASRLKPHQSTLKLRLAQASSLESFGAELEELVTVYGRKQTKDATLPSVAYYTRLMDELDVVGWPRLRQLSDDLRSLELEVHDKSGRKHVILVQLPLQYEDNGAIVSPTCIVDAPEPFALQWPRNSPHVVVLDEVLKQFELFLEPFQEFWNVLDSLDATTCVLDPQHPTRSTGRRRVALERHASVQFQVDPAHPRAMVKDVTFFGSQIRVGTLRERWNSVASSRWNETRAIEENLATVLELALPSPTTHKRDEFAIECGICYLYRFEEEEEGEGEREGKGEGEKEEKTPSQIPDILCENTKCHRPFHTKCLFDWLRALPTSRHSFHVVFGECPYCREAMSVKLKPES